MKLSMLLGERFKEKPSDAVLASHIFLLRGGYVRQVSNGIFSMLLPAKKIAQKIESIVREEMNKIDGQEILMPVVLPAEIWKESGRFDSVGDELVRFKDRTGRDMVLGMTHEEAAVHLARSEAKSYLKYPFMIYQIQTKFRDEPRSRGGLIRVREFTMKDAYSFHVSQADMDDYYNKVYDAYERIFERIGLRNVISVKSDSGMMGGNIAHEFMYLSEGGEDSIVICDKCGYKSNMEVATSEHKKALQGVDCDAQEIFTENVKDIESLATFLGIETSGIIKAVVYTREDNNKPVVVFMRGDLQVNEAKLKKILKTNVSPTTERDGVDLCFGFIGPCGLDNTGIEVLYDMSIRDVDGMVCGANKKDYHLRGVKAGRDFMISEYHDITKVNEGDRCNKCGERLSIKRGIEVGNIFQLGDKYTKSMNMTYTDENSQQQTPIMGCYGLGIGRLLACVVEDSHDAYGPIWPRSIAPWDIHLCILNNSIKEVKELGESIYEQLRRKYDVIMDDRDVSAGMQFADADLIGVPVRVIVSQRNMSAGNVEIVSRDKQIKKLVPIDQLNSFIDSLQQ